MDFNETLSTIIMSTLDDVNPEDVIKVLKNVGVKAFSHIKYIQESDLLDNLNMNKIQARMLVESFQNAVNNEGSICEYTIVTEGTEVVVPVVEASQPVLHAEETDAITINWNLLPNCVLKSLEKGEEIKPSEFRTIVRIIVDEIFRTNTNPQKKFVVKVAEKCTQKFPALRDEFNMMTLGTGYDNLAYRLYTRIENLRRKLPKSPQTEVDSPPLKKRKTQIDSYGCVAWSVPLPDGITSDYLISKKEILLKTNLDSEMEQAITLLKETYYLQRVAINNNCAIEELLKDWPVMFTERGIAAHFQLLTNIDLYGMLEKTVTSKGKILLSFFKSSKKKEVKVLMTETDLKISNPNELLLMVLGLAKYFDESANSVFFTNEVFNPHDLQSLPKHPCLVGKGTSILNCDEFLVTMDGIAVNTIKDATVAVATWFASYYVFNYRYPLELSCSLEFFQRCFVGINPLSGSKVERKKGKRLYQGIHPKILSFLKELKIFDSWVKDCRK